MSRAVGHRTLFLLLQLLRRDKVKLLIWIVSLSLFAGGVASSIYEVYGKSKTSLLGMFETLKNPAMIALCGPTKATQKTFTIGAMYAQEMVLFTSILFAIVSILHVIHRTREEEEDGVREWVRAFPVGRLASTSALLLEMALVHLAITGLTTVVLQVQHLSSMDFAGNLLFSATLSLQGVLWGAIALVFAQLFASASSVRTFSLSLLGILYIVRMGTDLKAASLSWLNLLSWSYLVDVYVKNNWFPVWLACFVSFVFVGIALSVEITRDLGGSIFYEREGRLEAKRGLLSLQGLIFRLQKQLIVAWSVGLLVIGSTYGSIFGDIETFFKKNQLIQQMFLHNNKYSLQEQFMGTLFLILAILSTVFALSSLMKLVSEEKKNHWTQVVAMKQSRTKFYFLHVLFAVILGGFGQLMSVLGLYGAQYSVMKQPIPFWEVVKSGMIWLPAIACLIGGLACLIGFLPRFAVILWGYVGFSFVVSYLGPLMKLPKWVDHVDVFSYIPRLPMESMNWGHVLAVFLLSVGLIIVGWFGYRRRDLLGD